MKKRLYLVMVAMMVSLMIGGCESEEMYVLDSGSVLEQVEEVKIPEEQMPEEIGEVADNEEIIEESEESDEEYLSPDNCPELAEMLANKAELDESYEVFAEQYEGRIIEFDGRIDYCTNHENYDTRFDYLVSAGDYDPNTQVGPVFKFENVSYYDLNTDLDTVSVGLNVHIVAEVVLYDPNTGLFFLEPVSVIGREE